jgi:hypothetical protein
MNLLQRELEKLKKRILVLRGLLEDRVPIAKVISKSFAVLIGTAFLLSGCEGYPRKSLDEIAPKEAQEFAQSFLGILENRDYGKARSLLSREIVKPGLKSNLERMASLLNKSEAVTKEIVACTVSEKDNRKRSNLTYQYSFENDWILASVVVESISGRQRIVGISVKPIPKSLKEIHAFTFSGKKFQHYFILAVAAFIPLLILYSLIICIRSKVSRKWLWVIFVLIGIGRIHLNWTTGEAGINPLGLHLQLLGSGISQSNPYAPWIVTISFPVGAILFFHRWKKTSKPENPQQGSEGDPESTEKL